MTGGGRPLVACVMPAYNHAAYVGEAVRSVLDQAEDGLLEVVAVDDASPDGTYDVLAALAREHPALTVLRNDTNVGGVATALRGIAATTAPYLTALPSDDRWLPGRLRRQLDALESGAQWSFGRADVIDASGARTSAEPQGWPPDADGMLRTLLRGQAVYAPTLMYRRDLLERVGGLRPLMWEDLGVTLRWATLAEPVFHPEALVEYRVHGANAHLSIVERGAHAAAHTEAVRALLRWDELPAGVRPDVEAHLRVWEALAAYYAGEGALRALWSAPADVVDGIVARQAYDLVRDLPGDAVTRLEVALRARGAHGAARRIAEVRGGPLWRRATRKAGRVSRRFVDTIKR